jgi:glyoxylase-like metal-dependent hydrolase (beta-lactamase superfamily II)
MSALDVRKLKGSSYVVAGPTNIGLVENNNDVVLIDSGNDKDSGRKLRKLLEDKKWKLKAIINTHSNADHIGGNSYLQRNTDCKIYASKIEAAFIESPQLESSFLWGGYPNKDISNKFFKAEESEVFEVINDDTKILQDASLSVIRLPGHFFDMIGIMTIDNVAYIGDCIFAIDVLDKYKIPFIYDVKKYKETIENVMGIKAEYYVMSHGEVKENIDDVAKNNLRVVDRLEEILLTTLRSPMIFEKILKDVCNELGILLNCGQYALVGSTIRSFLTYLNNVDKIEYEFMDNEMVWKITG